MIAERLAEFALTAQPSAASEAAQKVMALSLYDWMVCGLAGQNEPVSQILRDSNGAGLTIDGFAVFGGFRVQSATAAALISGATSHALDYDDTHFAHIGHPSVAVFPAAFYCKGPGKDLLWAALLGAEISVRIGLWLGRSHYQTGFHQTATSGAFGAAAAAGRLLGLSQSQLEAALGLAATQAAGLKSQFGTMGKPYHAGLAARTGLEAAHLAMAGFDTRGAGLDGPQGFGPTHHGENNLDAFDSLGSEWMMARVSHKFHACCHGLHAMLEAMSDAEYPTGSMASLTVQTHPRWLSVCNIQDPKTGLETKFSYRHTAAMSLMGYDTASLDAFTDALAHDHALVGIRQQVVVQTDDTLPETAVRVIFKSKEGETKTVSHDLAQPLSFETRSQRLRAKGIALLGDSIEALLWNAVFRDEGPSPDALNDLMCFEIPA